MIKGTRGTQPLPIPAKLASVAPLVSIQFNEDWLEFVIGLLAKGLQAGYWDESTGDIQKAWDSIAWMMDFKAGGSVAEYCLIRDEKAAGVHGGTSSNTSFHHRNLNTVYGDDSFVTLSANRVTLAAGTYIVRGSSPGVRTAAAKLSIWTTSPDQVLVVGNSVFAHAGTSTVPSNRAVVNGIVESDGTMEIRLIHSITVGRANSGLGFATSDGSIEVYSTLEIQKIG